jgi:hypothetical protein
MTENDQIQADLPEPSEATAPDTVDEDSGDDDAVLDPKMRAHLHKLREEARTQRSRALAAEADRERLITQVAAAQHRDAEHVAAEHLIDQTDLWRYTDPDKQREFYDHQFGEIVPDRVAEAAKAIAAQKPHLAKPSTAPPPTDRPIEGLRPGARAEEKPSAPSWASALRGT